MKLKYYIGVTLLLLANFANAAEVSQPVKITEIRSLIDGNVFFTTSAVAICGTTVLKLVVKDDGSKAAYSALLSAAIADKNVVLETWVACESAANGWGSVVQAVTVKF